MTCSFKATVLYNFNLNKMPRCRQIITCANEEGHVGGHLIVVEENEVTE